MKKLTLLIFAFCVFLTSTNAQTKKPENSPDEQSIVKKEYDENGNLIAYDSTYFHQWSSDTTFNFNFDEDLLGSGFMDFNEMMQEFFVDSAIHSFSFPFNDDDFFRRFEFAGPDSVWMKNFPNRFDSIPFFDTPSVFDLQKRLQEQFKYFNFSPPAIPEKLNDAQRKELEELRLKHQKELEELKKKWNREEK